MPTCYEHDLLEQGFILTDDKICMHLNLLNKLPKMQPDFITIEEVKQNDDLKMWIQPINEAFGEENEDDYRNRNADILNSGNQKLRHFKAYYNNEIAASSTLFFSQDAVMVFNLATKIAFQHKGLGTTLMLHMLNIAKNCGYKHCFLESSYEGYDLYKEIGFQVYCTSLVYEKTT